MLTGDSESSAISAALGSGIVESHSNVIVLNDIESEHECLSRLNEAVEVTLQKRFKIDVPEEQDFLSF